MGIVTMLKQRTYVNVNRNEGALGRQGGGGTREFRVRLSLVETESHPLPGAADETGWTSACGVLLFLHMNNVGMNERAEKHGNATRQMHGMAYRPRDV